MIKIKSMRDVQKFLLKTGRVKLKTNLVKGQKQLSAVGKFKFEDLTPLEKEHKNWNNKKEMKAYKKLKTKQLTK